MGIVGQVLTGGLADPKYALNGILGSQLFKQPGTPPPSPKPPAATPTPAQSVSGQTSNQAKMAAGQGEMDNTLPQQKTLLGG